MSSYFEDDRPDANRPDPVPGVTAAGADRDRLDFAHPGSDGGQLSSDEQDLPRDGLDVERPQEPSAEEDVGDEYRKRKGAKKKKILIFSAACLVVAGGLYAVMDESPAPRKPSSAASAMGFEEPSVGRRSTSGLEEFVPAASVLPGPASAPTVAPAVAASAAASVPAPAVALVAASAAASVPAPAAPPLEALQPRPSATPASSVSTAASSPAVAPVSADQPEVKKPERRNDTQEEKRPPRSERPSAPAPAASARHSASQAGASASTSVPEKTIALAGYHLDAIYPTSGDVNLIAYIRTPAGARAVKVGDTLPNGIEVVAIRNSNRSMSTTAGKLKME